ncbi:MAG TPA: zinc-binding dehydrogenase, partial [Miltoncostaeaceae bacterium]|nr:zinc-binding dehydrogenase [Miltoncostaeaceae bacterium]
QRPRRVLAALHDLPDRLRAGRFYLDVPPPPYVAGAEAVGEVVEGGEHPPGTLVWCLRPTGLWAEEFTTAGAHAVVPLPAGTDPFRAAALGIAGLAGWMPITRARTRPGETVAVLGASGVVGQVAVQAARLAGAGRVVALARSAAGRARARDLGAHEVVALDGGDLTAAVRRACPDGVDVVVDTLWGPPLQAVLPVLSRGGRMVQVGSAAAPTAELPGGPLRGGRLELLGFSVFSEAPADLAPAYAALVAAAARGDVDVPIATVPLAEGARAWEAVRAGAGGVKHVLVPG